MSKPVIGYAGMTHLGLVSASAAAGHGFRTVAFDQDPALIARLKQGDLPISEPDLAELIAAHKSNLAFSADAAALSQCDVVYVAVDVPTDTQGQSDLTSVKTMVARIWPHLSAKSLLVILSQVPPGFTRTLGLPPDRVYYQVETLVFGRAVERASNPERFIIGTADPRKSVHPSLQAYLESFGCPILPMAYESAELAKISINFCLVASISVANTLAEVCEHVGADWSDIVPALKLDKRIGPSAYLTPGLGIAGGNLERDLRTVIKIGEAKNTDVGVPRAWLANSAHRKEWTVENAGGKGARRQSRRDDRHTGSCVQRKYTFHQKFALSRLARAFARQKSKGSRSRRARHRRTMDKGRRRSTRRRKGR